MLLRAPQPSGAQPDSALAWDTWANLLEREGRLAEALAARDTNSRLSSGPGATVVDQAYFLIRGGDYAAADRLLAAAEQVGSAEERQDALWWHIVSLRNEGRPRAAAALARRYLTVQGQASITLRAALFEAGDWRAAASAFDSAARQPEDPRRISPGMTARRRAWAFTQRANVAAAVADTAALRLPADSVAAAARGSAFGRDHRLPAYVHGLLLVQQGHLAPAAESFRAAVYSPTQGYPRINAALIRVYPWVGEYTAARKLSAAGAKCPCCTSSSP